jgi:hypothetical protein
MSRELSKTHIIRLGRIVSFGFVVLLFGTGCGFVDGSGSSEEPVEVSPTENDSQSQSRDLTPADLRSRLGDNMSCSGLVQCATLCSKNKEGEETRIHSITRENP